MSSKPTQCRVCGADTKRRLGDPPRKFCSLVCYWKSREGQRPAIPPEKLGGGKQGRLRQRKALWGRPQTDEHKRKRAESMARTLASQVRTCVKCGDAYQPTSSAQRYCSGRCWQSARRRRTPSVRFTVPKAEYQRLLQKQDCRCAICGSISGSNGRNDRLAVDHCHNTNEVRGLLCHRCNTAIGLMRDDVDLLASAIRYLSK